MPAAAYSTALDFDRFDTDSEEMLLARQQELEGMRGTGEWSFSTQCELVAAKNALAKRFGSGRKPR